MENKFCCKTECWNHATRYCESDGEYYCDEHYYEEPVKPTNKLLPQDDFEFFQMINIFSK